MKQLTTLTVVFIKELKIFSEQKYLYFGGLRTLII